MKDLKMIWGSRKMLTLLLTITVFYSCQKDQSAIDEYRYRRRISLRQQTDSTTSTPADSTTTSTALPAIKLQNSINVTTDTLTLNGSASTGATSYLWTQELGKAATIVSASSAKTLVKNLATGEYRFRLKGTNTAGSSSDTVHVSVTLPSSGGSNTGTTQTPSTPTQPGYSPDFPRLGAGTIGGGGHYGNSTFLNLAAKYNVVVLGYWPGWSENGYNPASIVNYIHSNSKVRTKVINYTIPNEQRYAPIDGSNSAYTGYENYLTNTNSWLYPVGASGTPVLSTWPGTHIANITNFAPTVNGKRWNQYHPHASWDCFFNGNSTPYGLPKTQAAPLDGLYIDNLFSKPRVSGDWNRDGKTDDPSTAASWLRDGELAGINQIRTDCPSCYVIGNTADWLNGTNPKGVLDQAIDGGIMEGQIGESWSPKSTAAMMNSYKYQMDMYRGDKLGIFSAYCAATDYQMQRYALTSCLMGNGYLYIYTTQNKYDQNLVWMDEFNFNLGQARQTPVYSANYQGAYMREFDNGIVIMNPDVNGTKTITLPGKYYKLKGSQSSYVTVSGDANGVTTVTLLAKDGIVLSKLPTNN